MGGAANVATPPKERIEQPDMPAAFSFVQLQFAFRREKPLRTGHFKASAVYCNSATAICTTVKVTLPVDSVFAGMLQLGDPIVVGGDHVSTREHADNMPPIIGSDNRYVVDVLACELPQSRVQIVVQCDG